VSGTLTYAEPATLSPEASAVVVLVEHSGNPITARIIESQVLSDPGEIPISFELPFTADEIDPEALYTVSAAIVDGSRLWITDGGTRVITYDNPIDDVALELVYRPDLLKGQVTGEISGPGITLGGTGFAAAVLFDATSNQEIGMTVVPAPTGVPIAFSVPFDPAEIDDTADYTVVAGIVEGDNRWANLEGVPVITGGNPLSDITVTVSAVEPTPSPSPEPPADSGPTILAIIVLLLVIAAIVGAVIWYMRSRSEPPPEDGSSATAPPPTEPPVDEPPAAPGGMPLSTEEPAVTPEEPAPPVEELPREEP
jgi:uncharacterized lipoprotein YbaY